jgi:hypothetical protein
MKKFALKGIFDMLNSTTFHLTVALSDMPEVGDQAFLYLGTIMTVHGEACVGT